MFIYFFILIVVVIFSAFLHKKKVRKLKKIIFFTIALLLTLLPSIRSKEVGTDTDSYVRIFESTEKFQDILLFKMEVGYSIFSFVCSYLFTNYFFLLTIIAFVVVITYTRIIAYFSQNYFLSFYIYITSGIYVFFFNGARQGIAAALTTYSIIYIVEKRIFQYIILILIAISFHKTAVIMLPIYFLVNRPNSYKFNLLIIIITLLIITNLQSFVGLITGIDDRYESYGENSEGGGLLTILFNILLGFVFLFLKKFIKKKLDIYNIFLNLYLLCMIISIVALFAQSNPSGFLRLTIYFSWTTIFMWPIVIMNINQQGFRLLLYLLIIIFYGIYFYFSLLMFSNMVPFTINPIIKP